MIVYRIVKQKNRTTDLSGTGAYNEGGRWNNGLLEQSIRAVNISLTLRNWYFGYYIVEFEQNGNDRAEYGKGLMASISKEMKEMHPQ